MENEITREFYDLIKRENAKDSISFEIKTLISQGNAHKYLRNIVFQWIMFILGILVQHFGFNCLLIISEHSLFSKY